MDPDVMTSWWSALGSALALGGLLGFLVSVFNAWKP